MKKIIPIILIFFILTTNIFCVNEEYEYYEEEEEENNGFDNLTEEDIKKLQDMISKILPYLQSILNEFKNPKTNGEKFIYEVLDKISQIIDLLAPLLDKDPQTFLDAFIQINNKFTKYGDYFQLLIENINIDELIDAYFSFLTNDKIIQIYEILKDDIIYFLKKDLGEEGAIYCDIIDEIYPNIINLIKSDDVIEFLKKILLISYYNGLGPDHFRKEYDVKVLGEEAKKIYNDKIKNNEDFKIIVSKITEKIPFISQSMIDYYINYYIDSLVNNNKKEYEF